MNYSVGERQSVNRRNHPERWYSAFRNKFRSSDEARCESCYISLVLRCREGSIRGGLGTKKIPQYFGDRAFKSLIEIQIENNDLMDLW